MPFLSRVLVTFSGVCFVMAGLAQGQPSLSNMTPQGLLPGQSTLVTVRGENLTKPVQLWSPSLIKIEEITVADCLLYTSDAADE